MCYLNAELALFLEKAGLSTLAIFTGFRQCVVCGAKYNRLHKSGWSQLQSCDRTCSNGLHPPSLIQNSAEVLPQARIAM